MTCWGFAEALNDLNFKSPTNHYILSDKYSYERNV